MIAPPEGTRDKSYKGHGERILFDLQIFKSWGKYVVYIPAGRRYKLLYASSETNKFSDLNKYSGKTCVKLWRTNVPNAPK